MKVNTDDQEEVEVSVDAGRVRGMMTDSTTPKVALASINFDSAWGLILVKAQTLIHLVS